MNAKGPFEVRRTNHPSIVLGESSTHMMRVTFHKDFQGDLQASSVVEFMGVMDPKIGSGGYVAIERVDGTLQGKKGTFLLQHSSLMTRGTQNQTIVVIPDSATGELVGLTGSMVIHINEGKHTYHFHFTLPGMT